MSQPVFVAIDLDRLSIGYREAEHHVTHLARLLAGVPLPVRNGLNVYLLRNCEGIFYFDAEISNGAFRLGVAE